MGYGSKNFVPSGGNPGAYIVGDYVKVFNPATGYSIEGEITNIASSIEVTVYALDGSGTYSNWSFTIAGRLGSTGSQGSQGPQGPQGAIGSQGSQGPQGPQGAIGSQGSQGPQGPQGAIGSQGSQGPQGAQGPQGPQGAQGPLGSAGAMNYAQTQATKQSTISAAGTTIVSASITTTGYPVQVLATGDVENNSAGGWVRLQLYRDSTAIGKIIHAEGSAASENSPYAITVVDTPSAGTYTYAMKLVSSAGGTFNFGETDGPVLTAIELTGKTGSQGPQGPQGAGVPVSGTQGQIIVKNSATNYDTVWTNNYNGFKNFIINGDFRINQRLFSSTTANLAAGFDRWLTYNNGGTTTYSSQAFTLGSPAATGYESPYYARVVTASQSLSTHFAFLYQNMESVRTFAGETITISFWARAATGTPKVGIEINQSFGTGGSPSGSVLTNAGSVTLSTAWTRFNVTVAVPSISGKTIGSSGDDYIGLSLFTSLGSSFTGRAGSIGLQNATIDFWGVQVERGSYITPFELRPYAQELAMCQRFFQRIYYTPLKGVGNSSTTVGRMSCLLPVPMRGLGVLPLTIGGTPSLYDGASITNLTGISTNYSHANAIEFDATSAVTWGAGRLVTTYQTGTPWWCEISADL
jgi:hypothetical protein